MSALVPTSLSHEENSRNRELERRLRKFSEFEVIEANDGVKVIKFNPSKGENGRVFEVLYNPQVTPIEGFETLKFVYLVRFLEMNSIAGDHYHDVKHEIMMPIIGGVTIQCKNILGDEAPQAFRLNAEDHTGLYVPTGVAHSIRTEVANTVLLVFASEQSQREDEISYRVPFRDEPTGE